jgi:thiamine transport system substrate-binding protein
MTFQKSTRATKSSGFSWLAALATLAIVSAACGDDLGSQDAGADCFAAPEAQEITSSSADGLRGTTIRFATHDSFVLSEGTLEAFTEETGIIVEQSEVGDAGQVVSQSILTKDNPTADVLFGIDNTFLCRGLEAGLFSSYESPGLASVDDALRLDPFNRVTPISYGDVCVNYWADALPGDAPTSLDDLIDSTNRDQFVTENPETSSPGFAFLLATIAKYGEDGWEDYWRSLVENGVSITSGWNEAYYGEFTAGGGPRALVTSYASSPPAEVIFADPPIDVAPTGIIEDSCFRQIEFAGILAGTEHPEASAALIDFMLGTTYQEDVPLNMFVYPSNQDAELPEAFVKFGPLIDNALTIDPTVIEANRDDWTERWNDIIVG